MFLLVLGFLICLPFGDYKNILILLLVSSIVLGGLCCFFAITRLSMSKNMSMIFSICEGVLAGSICLLVKADSNILWCFLSAFMAILLVIAINSLLFWFKKPNKETSVFILGIIEYLISLGLISCCILFIIVLSELSNIQYISNDDLGAFFIYFNIFALAFSFLIPIDFKLSSSLVLRHYDKKYEWQIALTFISLFVYGFFKFLIVLGYIFLFIIYVAAR